MSGQKPDAVADATGITAAAEAIREYGPKAIKTVIKATLNSGGKSAAQQDMEDLRNLRQEATKNDRGDGSERKSQKFTAADKCKIDAKTNARHSTSRRWNARRCKWRPTL